MAGASKANRAREPSTRWRLDALLLAFMAYTMVLIYDQVTAVPYSVQSHL